MAHASIQTNNGIKIQIEGTPEEIASIIQTIEGNISENTSIKSEQQKKPPISNPVRKIKSSPTATDLILELKQEGFFNKPQGLADIKSALETRAHIYPMSTLSGVVLPLVKKRELRRMRKNKRWIYVKS